MNCREHRNAYRLMLAAAAMGTLLMTGCGALDMQESGAAAGGTVPGVALNGVIHGGQQGVAGATLQLYQVGTSGYGSAATPLLTKTVTSTGGGFFSISNDYSCSSGTYVYLTATGGNPGLAQTTKSGSSVTPANPASAMMVALGDCGKLSSGTTIWMNEVTTAAAVWALQQFIAIVPGTTLAAQPGTNPVTTGTPPAFSVGTSSTNMQGLINAFEVASLLANTSTGVTPGAFAAAYTGPGTSANRVLTVETWHLNTIANILASCVNTDTTSGDADYSSTCSSLGTAVTPSGTAAADTLQIAYEMAQNPSYNVQSTFGYAAGTGAPFSPADSAVADWTLAYSVQYNYSANTSNSDDFTVMNTAEGIAFDSYGNAWIGNTGHQYSYLNAYLTELDPAGNFVSTYNSYSVGGTSTSFAEALAYNAKMQVAIDPNNNVWVADTGNYNLVRYAGAAAAGAAGGAGLGVSYGTGTGYLTNLASDAAGNMYITLAGSAYSSTFGASGNRGIGVLIPGVSGSTLTAGTGSTVQPAGNTTFAGVAVTQSSSSTYGGGGFLYATSTNSYCSAPGSASLNMYFTKAATVAGSSSSTTTTIGEPTPVNAIANSPTTGNCTTVGSTIPSVMTSYGGASYTIPAIDTMQGLSVDSSDNLWTVNAPTTVYASGFPQYWVSELTPQYVAVPTTGALVAAYSPNVYTAPVLSGTSNGATLTFQPGQYVVTDGGNNIWIQSGGALGTVASVSAANGVLPTTPIIATGFASGTTAGYTGDWVCAGYCGGLTNTFYSSRRDSGGAGSGIAVDLSGNVWKIFSNSGADSVQILVGAAVPAVMPISLAAKNHTFGTRP